MKERPILFSAPMVRALLNCTKSQTRRIVKPQPYFISPENTPRITKAPGLHPYIPCPYGQAGDQLWVREAFSGPHCMDASDGCRAVPPSKWGDCSRIWYWADGNPTEGDWTRPRPSIHMPRWASRILLEVTGVRVERLQDISDADSVAEGIPRLGDGFVRWHPDPADVNYTGSTKDPRLSYKGLWESINGPGSWDANPWVWVVEFKRVMA